MDRTYIVRHYSHTYLAKKVRNDGNTKFSYYELISIHKEYKSKSVGASGRGVWISSRTTNNYVGDIVRKDRNTVFVYEPPEPPKPLTPREEFWYSFIGIGFIALIILLLLFS